MAVPAPPPTAAQDAPVDPTLYSAMEWRGIGPFRGGRSVAVAGVPDDPQTYYMGTAGGGVWKTADAGVTWRNVTDGRVIHTLLLEPLPFPEPEALVTVFNRYPGAGAGRAGAGVEDARVGHVHGEIRRSRVLVHVQDELPGPPAVGGAEDPPLLVGAIGSALRRDVDQVRIVGMNPDAGDGAGAVQPQMRPSLPRVRGAIDPVAVGGHHAPDGVLAHAGVDDVGIGSGHRDSRSFPRPWFSADGRWVAFVSDESGSSEVYLAPVDDPGARRVASSVGGLARRWRGDGDELYFLGPDRAVMVVEVGTGGDTGSPRILFELDGPVHSTSWDVAPGGDLFLVDHAVRGGGRSPVRVLVNWPGATWGR